MNGNRWRLMLLCLVILGGFVFVSCGEKTVDSIVDEHTDTKKEIVWQVCHGEYVKMWQEPLNELLKKKGVSYTVKIQSYYDMIEEQTETGVQRLRKLKENDEQVDVITVFPTAVVDGEWKYTYRVVAGEGLLLPLDAYLKTAGGERIKEVVSPKDLDRTQINGTTYGIESLMPGINATAYNKKYLEKYKINAEKLSNDIFENTDVLECIKSGEQGKVIPYLADSHGVDRLCMYKISPSEVLVYEKGKIVNVFETDEIQKYFYQLQELKEKDLVKFNDRYNGGEFFSVSFESRNDEIFETIYSSFDEKGNQVDTDVIVIPNISQPFMGAYSGDLVTGIAAWTQNEPEALDFLTLLYTDQEVANLITYGVKGEDYIVENNHAIYKDENPLHFFGEWFTNPLIAYPQKDMADNPRIFLDEYNKQIVEDIPEGFRFDTVAVEKEITATNYIFDNGISEYGEEVDNLFHLDTNNVDTAIAEINGKLKAAGIDKIIEEAEKQLAEWKKGK